MTISAPTGAPTSNLRRFHGGEASGFESQIQRLNLDGLPSNFAAVLSTTELPATGQTALESHSNLTGLQAGGLDAASPLNSGSGDTREFQEALGNEPANVHPPSVPTVKNGGASPKSSALFRPLAPATGNKKRADDSLAGLPPLSREGSQSQKNPPSSVGIVWFPFSSQMNLGQPQVPASQIPAEQVQEERAQAQVELQIEASSIGRGGFGSSEDDVTTKDSTTKNPNSDVDASNSGLGSVDPSSAEDAYHLSFLVNLVERGGARPEVISGVTTRVPRFYSAEGVTDDRSARSLARVMTDESLDQLVGRDPKSGKPLPSGSPGGGVVSPGPTSGDSTGMAAGNTDAGGSEGASAQEQREGQDEVPADETVQDLSFSQPGTQRPVRLTAQPTPLISVKNDNGGGASAGLDLLERPLAAAPVTGAEEPMSFASKVPDPPMPPPVPATPTLQQLPKSAAASQIAIRLDSDDNSGHVEVRIRERAGDVQIAVRSTDADVANTLRQDLGDLARRLDPRNSSDSDSGTRQARHSGAGNSSSGYTLPDDRQQQRQRQQQQHTLHHAPQIDAKGDSLQELQNILSEIRNGVVSK